MNSSWKLSATCSISVLVEAVSLVPGHSAEITSPADTCTGASKLSIIPNSWSVRCSLFRATKSESNCNSEVLQNCKLTLTAKRPARVVTICYLPLCLPQLPAQVVTQCLWWLLKSWSACSVSKGKMSSWLCPYFKDGANGAYYMGYCENQLKPHEMFLEPGPAHWRGLGKCYILQIKFLTWTCAHP